MKCWLGLLTSLGKADQWNPCLKAEPKEPRPAGGMESRKDRQAVLVLTPEVKFSKWMELTFKDAVRPGKLEHFRNAATLFLLKCPISSLICMCRSHTELWLISPFRPLFGFFPILSKLIKFLPQTCLRGGGGVPPWETSPPAWGRLHHKANTPFFLYSLLL